MILGHRISIGHLYLGSGYVFNFHLIDGTEVVMR